MNIIKGMMKGDRLYITITLIGIVSLIVTLVNETLSELRIPLMIGVTLLATIWIWRFNIRRKWQFRIAVAIVFGILFAFLLAYKVNPSLTDGHELPIFILGLIFGTGGHMGLGRISITE